MHEFTPVTRVRPVNALAKSGKFAWSSLFVGSMNVEGVSTNCAREFIPKTLLLSEISLEL